MLRPIDSMKRWWWRTGDQRLPCVEEPHAAPAPPPEPPWLKQLDRAGLLHTLTYPTTTLGRMLDQTADRFGDAPALVFEHKQWSYRELLAHVNRTAAGLAGLGVRRGDRVLLALPNCPEYVSSFLAIQKLGALVVNAGPLMGSDDLERVMAMTTPRVAIGLDLLAPTLSRAGKDSTLEHHVWVSLQFYQPMLRRLGYQIKLWQSRNGNADGRHARHVTFDEMREHAPARPPTVSPDPQQTAVLQPTGGTTGTLKLAQLTHRSMLANAMQVSAFMGSIPGQERVLAALPMFHVYGLTLCLISPVFSAASMILMTRFHAGEAMQLARRYHPTLFPLVPAICDAISDLLEREGSDNGREDGAQGNDSRPHAFAGLRLCISGAAPLPVATADRFHRLTGGMVIEGYGLTEASPVTHANPPSMARHGSIGLPLADTLVRVVSLESGIEGRDVAPGEPGEMLLSGPQVMSGYFADPEQTRGSLTHDADGQVWLHTGDLVRYDEDGYFYVVGRKKDMIIRSGLKVYPSRVEKVLSTHPQVREVAVVGRVDAVHTEMVAAVVVPIAPPEDPAKLVEELKALCREHLAPYEVPCEFDFVEKLPRSPLGKLLRRELRERPRLPAPTTPRAVENPNGKNGKEAL